MNKWGFVASLIVLCAALLAWAKWAPVRLPLREVAPSYRMEGFKGYEEYNKILIETCHGIHGCTYMEDCSLLPGEKYTTDWCIDGKRVTAKDTPDAK